MTASDRDNKQNRKQFQETEDSKLIIDATQSVYIWKREDINCVDTQKCSKMVIH